MIQFSTLFLMLGLATVSFAQQKKEKANEYIIQKNLSDSALLDIVQKQTIRYFWDFAHPVSGMARERSNRTPDYGDEVVTTGGTGFGVMALIVGVERKWLSRDSVAAHVLKMLRFLHKADSYHGAFAHWLNGETGKTIRFSRKDDGADLVETSLLFQGLLCAKSYFSRNDPKENEIRNRIASLWQDVEWSWFTRGGREVLYWHWSPNNGWAMNFPLHGYNEGLITYVLAASSPSYPIKPSAYHNGWAMSNFFYNGKKFYGYTLPLGFDFGGPLFFSQYSFLALDPTGLKDQYANYWEQNKNHSLINHAYSVDNPKKFKGFSENSWGLTAGDDPFGYSAHSPTNDNGTITPTAALSSFPYTPALSMKALRHFYEVKGARLWGEYGFKDGYNDSQNWVADSYLAIDQGPIVVMIENYRSGLLWNLFMKNPEIQEGLRKLGFSSPHIMASP